MKLLQQMSVMGHERLVFHQDPESDLRAIIAVHDTTLGNALGGTRRWCYASEEEAITDGSKQERVRVTSAGRGDPFGLVLGRCS